MKFGRLNNTEHDGDILQLKKAFCYLQLPHIQRYSKFVSTVYIDSTHEF